MRENIDKPVAEAVVRWLTTDEGGRQSGPPTAPVYMATAVFQGGDSEAQPGRPTAADRLSILLQKVGQEDELRQRCLVGFLVPDLARPHLRPGAELLVLEGPRVVASAQLTTVFEPDE